jgi:ATP synthase protein I
MSDSESEVVLESERLTQSSGSMAEYYQVKRNLLTITLLLSIGLFLCVWLFFQLDLALNYLLGASGGLVYLWFLARNVEKLGGQNSSLGKSHFAVFIVLIILAARLEQLQILPIFLGFLTYKVTLLLYVLQAAFDRG